VATGGLPLVAKSGGEAVYTGAKANLMDSKIYRNIFKDGRKKTQEEHNRKMEYKMAGGHKQERMEMEDLSKKEKEMKEKYGELENVGTLKKISNVGTKEERMIAYQKLNDMGKLKDAQFEEAMKFGEGNSLYLDRLNKGSGKSNEAELLKYHAKNYVSGSSSTETQKFVKDKMKNLIKKYNSIHPTSTYNPGSAASVDNFMRNNFTGINSEDQIRKAMNVASAHGKTSKELADFINKGDTKRIAEDVALYLQDPEFGGDEYLSDKDREMLTGSLNSEGGAVFRNKGIV
jgi:hypothetical protein